MNKLEIEKELNFCYLKARSAWKRGVIMYSQDLLADCKDNEIPTEKHLLNGADNWKEYSYGGCSLIYDEDICKRLCPPSVVAKTNFGKYRPNKHETWLDAQARALYQASRLVLKLAGMER